jgi:hypothetical protein
MKLFGILFTLFISIILMSGCNPSASTVPAFTKTVGQTATSTKMITTSPSLKDDKVHVNIMLNNQPNGSNTLVLTGNTLDISSVLICTFDGPVSPPVILVMDSKGNTVASWHVSKDSKMVSGLGFSQDNKPVGQYMTNNMLVTWDLKDMSTNVRVPPGQYTVLVTVYSYESNSLLPANGGSFTFTIK